MGVGGGSYCRGRLRRLIKAHPLTKIIVVCVAQADAPLYIGAVECVGVSRNQSVFGFIKPVQTPVMRYDRHRDQIIVSRVAPVEFVSIERCDIDIALDLRVSADYVRIGPRHLGDFVIVHSDVENFPHVLAVMGVHNPLGKVAVEYGHNRGVGFCQYIVLFLMFIGPIYERGNLGVQVFCGHPISTGLTSEITSLSEPVSEDLVFWGLSSSSSSEVSPVIVGTKSLSRNGFCNWKQE